MMWIVYHITMSLYIKSLYHLQGVLNAAPLAYIFPPLCVMKLKNERFLSLSNVPAILITVFGVLVSIIGIIMAIIEMVNGVKCSHGEEMPYCSHPSQHPQWNFTKIANASANLK